MNLKLKIVAAAALAMGAAGASAQTINMAGASATRAILTNAVVESVCGAAGTVTVYRNGTNQTRIVCSTTIFGGASTLDFSYDNAQGSWLGVGPVSGVPLAGTTFNGQTVPTDGAVMQRVNLTTCSGTGTETIGGKVVAVRTCTGNETTRVRPALGNTDVEADLFAGANLPANSAAPILSNIAQSASQFGISFGIVVSQALYTALQADQGLSVGATDEANRPSLSRAQVTALSTFNGGPLNTDWTALFRNAPPALASTPVFWARRVSGSGSQATFNANILNYICSPRANQPAEAANTTATYIVNEQGSTGNQLGQIASTTAYRAGFASRENDDSAVNWKFVKLDGVFPAKANVQNGRYNWFTEQVLTLRAGASTNEETIFNTLVSATASPTVIQNFTAAAREGTLALPFVADSNDPNYLTHRTRFRTLGNNCTAPFAVE